MTVAVVRPIAGRGRPRKFQIPDSFKVLGHSVSVSIVPDLEGNLGDYDHDTKEIRISEQAAGSVREQTFLHELMHCLLEHAGREDLTDDESFVDLLAELLYQFEITKKGYKNFEPRTKHNGEETLYPGGN